MSSSNQIIIVDAAFSDFTAIARIYSHYVLNTVATFELEPPDRDEMVRARINYLFTMSKSYPHRGYTTYQSKTNSCYGFESILHLADPYAPQFSRARTTRQLGLPYLAAYLSDRVVGYAYASPFRPRPAYDATVENSVYVDPEFLGRGIGRRLLDELISRCSGAGKRQMLAIIAGDAEESKASIALHRAAGFEQVGALKGVGVKFGREVDDVAMQRGLQP